MREHPKHRSQHERAHDAERISAMRLQRLSVRAIADELNKEARNSPIDFRTVASDARRLEKMWTTTALETVGQQKAAMLAELDLICAQAWAAWEASKKPIIRRHAEKINETTTKTVVTSQESTGDATLLRVLLDAQDRRSKLLGLDAPQKIDGTLSAPVGLGEPVIHLILQGPQDTWEGATVEVETEALAG